MQTINGINYITAEEALERRPINKAEYERWIYGGLTKKQHDHMIAMALETSRKSAQHRLHLTGGIQAYLQALSTRQHLSNLEADTTSPTRK